MRLWLLCLVAACGRLSFDDDLRTGTMSGELADADGPASFDGISGDIFVDTSCAYQCVVDVSGNSSTCSGAIVASMMGARGRVDIDLAGRTELELRATICDPTEWVLHLADSPTGDGGGGDAASTSNDAEAYLFAGTAYQVMGNDYAPVAQRVLVDQGGVLASAGCNNVVLLARDQYVELVQPMSLVTTSQYALRLNPPTDMEGTPDALWYVGINRTYGSMLRTGTGVRDVSLCLR